jgi:hypothetical protein
VSGKLEEFGTRGAGDQRVAATLVSLGMSAKTISEQLEEAFVQCRDLDASLSERLQAFADAVRAIGPHFQDAVDHWVARLREHDVGEKAPKPGEKMPTFVLPDEKGQLVSRNRCDHQTLLPEIVELDAGALGQRVHAADDELKVLGEQRPAVEAVPLVADLSSQPVRE